MSDVRGSATSRQNGEWEEVMKHSDVEGTGVIERYLQGRLDPAELDRFERHYFACPECLEQLELAETLQEGIRQTAVSESSRFMNVQTEQTATTHRRSYRQLLAIAALVLVSTATGAFLHNLGEGLFFPAADKGLVAPTSNTPVFFLGPERDGSGSEPSTRIRPTPELGGIVFALEVETQAAATQFQVRLSSTESPESFLWSGENFMVDHNGTLSLSLPSRFLNPGDYWLQVLPMQDKSNAETEGPVRRFVFRILPTS